MPSQIRHPEWRPSLAGTKYPFAPSMELTNSDGILLPEEGLIDAHLYPIGGKDGIYLSQLNISNEFVTFYIGDSSNSTIASGSLNLRSLLASPSDKRGTIVQLSDAHERPAGILVSSVIGMAAFGTLGNGKFTFQQTQTEFAATVCMPTPEIGVRGVILPDGTLMPEALSDELWFVGGDGITLTYELNTSSSKCTTALDVFPTIRIDAVGDPLFLRMLCSGTEGFATPSFIKTIRVKNDIKGCEDEGAETWDIDLKERDGRLFIQGNDNLAAHASLRVRTTAEGTIEVVVAGSPNYEV